MAREPLPTLRTALRTVRITAPAHPKSLSERAQGTAPTPLPGRPPPSCPRGEGGRDVGAAGEDGFGGLAALSKSSGSDC